MWIMPDYQNKSIKKTKPSISKQDLLISIRYYQSGSYKTLTNFERIWWSISSSGQILKNSMLYSNNNKHNFKKSCQESIRTSMQEYWTLLKDCKW